MNALRCGIDLGGTKIEGVVLTAEGRVVARHRLATPQGDYPATLTVMAELLSILEAKVGAPMAAIGVATPGAVSRRNGAMKNCNSTCLNGRFFREDLAQLIGRPVRIANDANCLALSEAVDGAAAGRQCVFGVILGTGVGGGVVVGNRVLNGPNRITGEWGHNPMPGLGSEYPDEQRRCYCGRMNCVETYLSGPGLVATYRALGGSQRTAQDIATAAGDGESLAARALEQYCLQLAVASAVVINILDPDVVVVGGGLSQIETVYHRVPDLWSRFVFSDQVETQLVPAKYGDASGVRGAAWLWPE